MFLRLTLTAILAVTLVSAQGKKGGRGGGGGGGEGGGFPMGATSKFDMMSEMLKLNKDQKKDFKTAMDDGQKEAAPVRDQLAKARLALGEAVAASKADEVEKLTANVAGLEAQMAEVEMKAFAKVYKSLDKEQIPGSPRLFQMMKGMFSEKNWNSLQ
jgi:hypothetical protein